MHILSHTNRLLTHILTHTNIRYPMHILSYHLADERGL